MIKLNSSSYGIFAVEELFLGIDNIDENITKRYRLSIRRTEKYRLY